MFTQKIRTKFKLVFAQNKMQANVNLSKFTTIKLGGLAQYFVRCTTREEILSALKMAHFKKLPFFILGGGSNVVFSDKGFKGLVIKIETKGISVKNNRVLVEAGESWDELVKFTVQKGLARLECLSGIPGSVGAAPIQNVGAYGQEVSQSITEVEVLNCKTLKIQKLFNADCRFDYRDSFFKRNLGKYIILSVSFKLKKSTKANIKYDSLANYLKENKLQNTLQNVRRAVLAIRAEKSMVLNKKDPNTRSCGSFFMNPIVDKNQINKLLAKFPEISVFKSNNKYKISAAWLIEKAGFKKGFAYKNVGISNNHSLALISKDSTTTKELLELEGLIVDKVYEKTGIRLKREPILV